MIVTKFQVVSVCNATYSERDYDLPDFFISLSSCQGIDSKQSTMQHSDMKALNLGLSGTMR